MIETPTLTFPEDEPRRGTAEPSIPRRPPVAAVLDQSGTGRTSVFTPFSAPTGRSPGLMLYPDLALGPSQLDHELEDEDAILPAMHDGCSVEP